MARSASSIDDLAEGRVNALLGKGAYGPFLVLIAAIIWAAKGFFEVYAWAVVVIMVLASVAVVWLSYEPGRGWRAGAAEQSYLYRLLSPRLFTTVAAAVYFGMFFYGNPDYQASESCGCWVTSLWLATVFGVFNIELLVGGGYAVYTASIQNRFRRLAIGVLYTVDMFFMRGSAFFIIVYIWLGMGYMAIFVPICNSNCPYEYKNTTDGYISGKIFWRQSMRTFREVPILSDPDTFFDDVTLRPEWLWTLTALAVDLCVCAFDFFYFLRHPFFEPVPSPKSQLAAQRGDRANAAAAVVLVSPPRTSDIVGGRTYNAVEWIESTPVTQVISYYDDLTAADKDKYIKLLESEACGTVGTLRLLEDSDWLSLELPIGIRRRLYRDVMAGLSSQSLSGTPTLTTTKAKNKKAKGKKAKGKKAKASGASSDNRMSYGSTTSDSSARTSTSSSSSASSRSAPPAYADVAAGFVL